MSAAVHPCWDRWSWDWGHYHFARRVDRTLTADELAYGLKQFIPGDDESDCRSAVELKDRTDEQEELDKKFRERAT